jgi:hypothetical protein
MTDRSKKITELDATSSVAANDVLVVVTNVDSSAVTKKATVGTLFANVVTTTRFSNTVTFNSNTSLNGTLSVNGSVVIAANGAWVGPSGGLTGVKGDTGDKGEVGSTGDKGQKGDYGVDGAKGETGAKGDTGATGDKGEVGDKGDTGAKGDTGTTGDTGAKGEVGDKGDAGSNGDKGEVGDKGDAGSNGDKGDTGAKGEVGDKGDKGDDGDLGDKGDKGDVGPNLTTTKFGYNTGGSVTQTTSRSTSVTLNALSGEVTLFGATMTAGQVDGFAMNNTSAAAGDMVICTVYGASVGTYHPSAYCSIDNAIVFTIRNLESYTTASESPVIKFIVVKAPTS